MTEVSRETYLKRKVAYGFLQSIMHPRPKFAEVSDQELEELGELLAGECEASELMSEFNDYPIAVTISDYLKDLTLLEQVEILKVLHRRDKALFSDLFEGN